MSNDYFQLSGGDFSEDWSDTGQISTNDNWSDVPSIIGYSTGDVTTATGVNPQSVLTSTGFAPRVVANGAATNTSGAVIEVGGTNPTIAFQGSNSADYHAIVIYLDSSGRENVTFSANIRDLDASADNAQQQVSVQYRIGDTGLWIDLPSAYIADATDAGSATKVSPISVTLPADANNQPQLQVRIVTTNAAGNDELIGVDDIRVTSAPLEGPPPVQPGTLNIADSTVVEGNAGTPEIEFTVTRVGGSDGAVSATWTVGFPSSANSADLAAGASLAGTVSFADGQTSATITVPIAGDTVFEADESFVVTLSNSVGGAALGDAQATGTIVNDDAAPPPPPVNVFINEIHYDNGGTDIGEAIEIAGLAGTNLAGWSLVLYTGSTGTAYNTRALSGTITDQSNGFGTLRFTYPVNGLQNGNQGGTEPDGIALVDANGRVVQFLSYEGAFTATNGPAAGLTSTDIGVAEEPAPAAGLSLQLVGTGSSYADFAWARPSDDNFGEINAGQAFLSGTSQGQIRVDNAQVIEGNDGQSQLVFTLVRAGGFASEADVAYTIGFGTADAGDIAADTPLSGTVTFGAGVFSQTISIPVVGDLTPEFNEWLFVQLGAVTGNAVVADGQAIGTIVNDDPIALTIMQIQGEGHYSSVQGQTVVTSGIVTAILSNGFYIQDSAGDGNARTSDAVFVFTRTTPTIAVGDAVSVTGRVTEFGSDLPLTEIDVTGNTAFGVTVTSSGNPLPAAVLVGSGGLTPPTESIDSDGLTIFNPETDGADFWESLEGMLVELDRPQVVAASDTAFGETYVVASHGEGATGMNPNGGITVSPGDYNPEMIQLDDTLIRQSGYVANHSVGDQLASLVGVVNYSFEHYELLLTTVPEVTLDVTLQPETVLFTGDSNYMTVATLNVENLDPSDGRYDDIALDIVNNLGSPDVIAVQEMQDNNGTGTGVLDGSVNAQGLIDAIFAVSGITYAYVEVAPTSENNTGGEPNGNIRSGYFYRVDRVDLVEGSVAVIEDPSFLNSRLPLIATWEFQGTEITTINVHFTSRLGSDPLWGADQPPVTAGEDRREDQAEAVGDWINNNLATDPAFNAIVLGDFNGFYFEEAQTQLGLVNLQVALLPEEERYSYVFEGNAQLLDNILVTGGLVPGAGIDAVHINAYFGAAGTSDHDPQVVRFLLGTRPSDIALDNASVAENLPAGTVVGTVTAEDAPGDRLQYSLVDDAAGRFAIDAATGVVTTLVALDHEALDQFAIIVRVTDAAGQSTNQSFVIAVRDVNEAPIATPDSAAVAEDATSANLWGALLGNDSDPDAGDSLVITAVDTNGTLGTVVLDAATQTLRYVADHDSFDSLAPGATALDSFTYTVTDESGLTRTATVTMTITGVDDGIVVDGGVRSDVIVGTGGEDRLSGGNGDDRLEGGDGHDLLFGGRGNDVLLGGSGNDRLSGDRGNDTLSGGAGDDLFVFGGSAGQDLITDFDTANDTIVLEDGQWIVGSRTTDLNGDGVLDLVIEFHQGSVGLLGIDSLGSVQVDQGAGAATAISPRESAIFASDFASQSGSFNSAMVQSHYLVTPDLF